MITLDASPPASFAARTPIRAWRSSSFRLTAHGHSSEGYVTRLANSPRDVRAAQALRFNVFNLELNEGFEESFDTLLDADPFDEACDHLVTESQSTGEVVGTYRLQTGDNAAVHCGYYSALEFDLSPYEPLRGEMIELGRACVARAHRNSEVLHSLWRGIAFYARTHGARYLLGCTSIHSRDAREGASLYSALMRAHLPPPELQTRPLSLLACPLTELAAETPKVPGLLGAHLALGAKVCGPPAMDRHFKTIDFLTILDLVAPPPPAAARYLH